MKRKYISAISLLLLMVSCASLSSPQGGPKDSLPPMVLETKPLFNSTRFENKRVEITFDEYVQLKDQQKLFVVSPESATKPKLTLRGKTLVASFEDSLQKDKTYRLDFGSSIADNNEGNKLDGFQFTFSTGDHIDSLMMVGQSLDAMSRDTVVGAFIKYFPLEMDSTFNERGLDSTLYKSYADAIFRSDSSGYYVADMLQGKPYRIYAYLDNNSSHKYEPGTDLVGFTDLVYNPLELPGFAFGYDTLRKRYVVDSLQVVFELFKEKVLRRQTFLAASRPQRNKLQFEFNAPTGVILSDSLQLSGIKREWLLEQRSKNGDTLTYWIAPPTKQELDSLQDTIVARFVYLAQDSLFNHVPMVKEQKFIHRSPVKELTDEQKREKKQKEREEARRAKEGETQIQEQPIVDSLAVSADSTLLAADSTQMALDSADMEEKPKLGFKVLASQNLNPLNNIVIQFDFPLSMVDTSRIELLESVTEEVRGVRRGQKADAKVTKTAIKPTVTVDNLQTLTISADWVYGGKYELNIPSGVLQDITFVSNDSLTSEFTILDPDKFGTLIFNLTSNDSGVVEDSTIKENVVLSDTVIEAQQDTIVKDIIVVEDSLLVATDSLLVDSLPTDSLPTIHIEPAVIDSLINHYTLKPVVEDKDSSTIYYIVELVSIDKNKLIGAGTDSKAESSQKVVQRKVGVKAGDSVRFMFLKPGKYFLRLIEDLDRNGEWTTGNLRERIKPERSRIYSNEFGTRVEFEAKENWEIEENVDIREQIEIL